MNDERKTGTRPSEELDAPRRQVSKLVLLEAERNRAEEALRESEARFRSLAENAFDLIAEADDEGRYLYASPNHLEILGLDPSELLGASFFGRLHPDDVARAVAHHQKSITSGLPDQVAYRIRHGDGTWRWLEIWGRPYVDSAGATRFAFIGRDITERKKTEQTLNARTRQQAAVSDLGQCALAGMELSALMDESASVVTRVMNVEYCEVLELLPGGSGLLLCAGAGWKKGCVGRATVDAGNQSQAGYTLKSSEPVIVEDLRTESRFDEAPLLRDHRVVSGIGVVIRGRGQPFGVLGAHTTRRRRFSGDDVHFLQSVADLIAGAIQRSREEAERSALDERMREAQKLESLGVLAGGIAHDFNNLLVGVLGNAHLALMDLEPNSPARAMIEDIEQSSERAAELTKQLLAYAGKGTFCVQAVDLTALAREMAQFLQSGVSKNAALEYESSPEPIWIRADAAQVCQVVMNLITNAAEALESRSGTVTLRTGILEADRGYLTECHIADDLPAGEYAYVEVEDTGCGMDPETLKRIFDPFYTSKFLGRGLGLAVVLGIVRSHRGTLKVESEPQRGTTFRVLFPAAKAPTEVAADPETGAEPWRGEGTVLVVDDEKAVRTVAARMLSRRGFDVLASESGAAAVATFREHADEVDAVLLDASMPSMDGEATFHALRSIRDDVPVIFQTGHSQSDAEKLTIGKSRVSSLQKPFTLATLTDKLREALEPGTRR